MESEGSPTPQSPADQYEQRFQSLAAEARNAVENATMAARRAEEETQNVRQQADQMHTTLRAQYEQEIAAARAQASVDATTSRKHNFGQARPDKPQRFSGSRKSDAVPLHTWLYTVEAYLTMTEQPQNVWTQFAGTFLEGAAQVWHVCRARSRTPSEMSDWASFKRDIMAQFEPVNSSKAARDTLANLTQRTSVQSYCTEFLHLVLQIEDMGTVDAVDRFMRGLKAPIRVQVDLRNPTTLEEAMMIAERYDVLSWQAVTSNRWNGHQPPPYRPPNAAPNNSWARPNTMPTPMEVGVVAADRQTEAKPGSTPAQARIQAYSNVCWTCNRPGHFASSCPERQSHRRAPSGDGRGGRR